MARGAWIGLCVLLAGAVGFALLRSEDREGPTGAAPGAPAEPSTDSGPGASGRSAVRSGRLTVHVHVPAKPRGELVWTTSEAAPRTSSMLDPGYGGLPPSAARQPHEGTATLDIPAGHWTWLRATADKLPGSAAYARIEPFTGERTLSLEIRPAQRVLHAFVLRRDLCAPVADAPVQVFVTPLDAPGAPALAATVRTDAFGYARIELAPGGFLVCAPGAKPGDPPPHVHRLILPDGMPITELPVTLVALEERRRVRFVAHATLGVPDSLPPRLYLKRLDDSTLLPFPEPVQPGQQTMDLDLLPGDYALDVLPLGALERSPEVARYTVPATGESSFALTLRTQRARIAVKLLGLERHDLPVSVYPQPLGRLLDEDPRILFVGPYHWNLAEQRVAPLPQSAHLVALGKSGCWISDRAYGLMGDLDARMAPATHLFVRCPVQVVPSGRADVTSGAGIAGIALAPRIVSTAGACEACCEGSVVVPRGPLRVQVLDHDDRVRFERQVEAREPAMVVAC